MTVVNQGSGDVPGGLLTVTVSADGFAPEVLGSGRDLRSGESVVMTTGAIQLTEPTRVNFTIDAGRSLTDVNRGNNSLNLTLSP